MDNQALRIDAHQHFWIYDPEQYPWIPKGSALERDWLPADLAREQGALDLHGSIAVQARQSIEETKWLLSLADESEMIRGVVGWVDLVSDKLEEELAVLTRNPKLLGVRHVAQDEPDDRFLSRADFSRGVGALRQFGLTYDLLIFPRQLPAAIELVRRHPEQPFVLDHIAKPEIRTGAMEPWRKHLQELAQSPNVVCKLSGIITEADHQAWTPDDLRPYLDVVFEVFGPERLMWGSDWPVCLLAGSYAQVHGLVEEYTRSNSSESREGIFGGNASRFYLDGRR